MRLTFDVHLRLLVAYVILMQRLRYPVNSYEVLNNTFCFAYVISNPIEIWSFALKVIKISII